MDTSLAPPPPAEPGDRRVAWIAGSSGLVGSALLARLLDDPHTGAVHALVRKLPDHPRSHLVLQYHPVDFDHLPVLPPPHDVFIALGTTLKVAGSQAAFRRVDFDAVVSTARAARAAGATRVALVSALGADATAAAFYNRVKGEAEAAVAALGFDVAVFAQPSLLLGDRDALGQPERTAERWAERLLSPVSAWIPKAIRPIPADRVAAALLETLRTRGPGVHRLSSRAMQPSGR